MNMRSYWAVKMAEYRAQLDTLPACSDAWWQANAKFIEARNKFYGSR